MRVTTPGASAAPLRQLDERREEADPGDHQTAEPQREPALEVGDAGVEARGVLREAVVDLALEVLEALVDAREPSVDPGEALVDPGEALVKPGEALVEAQLELAEILLGDERILHGCRERFGLTLGLLLGEASLAKPSRVRKRVESDHGASLARPWRVVQ